MCRRKSISLNLVYVDISRETGSTATLTLSLDPTRATPARMWEIKVGQINCGVSYA